MPGFSWHAAGKEGWGCVLGSRRDSWRSEDPWWVLKYWSPSLPLYYILLHFSQEASGAVLHLGVVVLWRWPFFVPFLLQASWNPFFLAAVGPKLFNDSWVLFVGLWIITAALVVATNFSFEDSFRHILAFLWMPQNMFLLVSWIRPFVCSS